MVIKDLINNQLFIEKNANFYIFEQHPTMYEAHHEEIRGGRNFCVVGRCKR